MFTELNLYRRHRYVGWTTRFDPRVWRFRTRAQHYDVPLPYVYLACVGDNNAEYLSVNTGLMSSKPWRKASSVSKFTALPLPNVYGDGSVCCTLQNRYPIARDDVVRFLANPRGRAHLACLVFEDTGFNAEVWDDVLGERAYLPSYRIQPRLGMAHSRSTGRLLDNLGKKLTIDVVQGLEISYPAGGARLFR